jgi:predicted ester cyclase
MERGRGFTFRELAMYRIQDGRIAAVWDDLDPSDFRPSCDSRDERHRHLSR